MILKPFYSFDFYSNFRVSKFPYILKNLPAWFRSSVEPLINRDHAALSLLGNGVSHKFYRGFLKNLKTIAPNKSLRLLGCVFVYVR